MSTESGIPDFRSVDGLYHQQYDYPPEEILSRSFFDARPEEFYRFYRDKMLCLDAQPNAGPPEAGRAGGGGEADQSVVTQNIDGLHQAAGSRRVWELHGSRPPQPLHEVRQVLLPWSSCGTARGVPRCACGGIVKPDVVLYEESLDGRTLEGALVRHPGGGYAHHRRHLSGGLPRRQPGATTTGGNRLVLINKTPTPYDAHADLVIAGPIGEILGGVSGGVRARDEKRPPV